MRILAIETSCDETAAAVVENGVRVLSNAIASQIDLHAETGGVVPEVAAREHVLKIIPVIDKALREAFETRDNNLFSHIDAIAVTQGPGLIGCLLVGVNTAKTLALLQHKPLIPVNHIIGHLYSSWLDCADTIHFPIVSLSVSGGHNELVLIRNHDGTSEKRTSSCNFVTKPRFSEVPYDFEILGETLDDAAGEAYDKVARIMGLGYPGGPVISKLAEKGNPDAYDLPRAWMETARNPQHWTNFAFSFSGLKSAVIRFIESHTEISKADLAASFQKAVNEVLSTKLLMAAQKYQAKEIHLVGGVSANSNLRTLITTALNARKSPILGRLSLRKDLVFRFPRNIFYCTDNAAMIASAAYFKYQLNPEKYRHWINFEASPSFGNR